MAGIKPVGIRAEVQNVGQARRDMRSLTADMRNFDGVNDGLSTGIGRTSRSMETLNRTQARVARSTPITTRAVVGLFAAYQAFRGLGFVTNFFRQSADGVTSINNQLRQVTNNLPDLIRVRRELEDISRATRTDFQSNVASFNRISLALPDSDLETNLNLLENFNRLGVIGGSSSDELSRSLVQLSQSFAGGIVRAEEFNSIIENTPAVVRQLASALGISVGQLRQRVLDGQLTAEDVLGGLTSEETNKFLDREFATIAPTIDGAFLVLRNQFSDTFGEFIDGTGLNRSFAMLALDLSDYLNSIGEAAVRNGMLIGNFFRGTVENFRNQGLIGALGDIVGGTFGQLDVSAIDISGVRGALDNIGKSPELIQLEEINAGVARLSPGVGDIQSDAGARARAESDAIRDFQRGEAARGIVGSISNIIDNVITPFVEDFGERADQQFRGAERTNVAGDFFRTIRASNIDLLENLQLAGEFGGGAGSAEATAGVRTSPGQFIPPAGFRLVDNRLIDANTDLAGTTETEAQIAAREFVDFVYQQRPDLPQVEFGRDRNADGSLRTREEVAQVFRDQLPVIAELFDNQSAGDGGRPPGPRVKTAEELAAEAAAAKAAIEAQKIAQRVFESQQATFDGLQDFLNEPFEDALREARNSTINSTTSALNAFGSNSPQGIITGIDELTGDDGALTKFADQLENGEGPLTSFFDGISNIVPGLGLLLAAVRLFGTVRETGRRVDTQVEDGQVVGGANVVRDTATGLRGLLRFITTGSRDRTRTRDLQDSQRFELQDAFSRVERRTSEFVETFGLSIEKVSNTTGGTLAENAASYEMQILGQVGVIHSANRAGETFFDTLTRITEALSDTNSALRNAGLREFNRDVAVVGATISEFGGVSGLEGIRNLRTDDELEAISRANFLEVAQRAINPNVQQGVVDNLASDRVAFLDFVDQQGQEFEYFSSVLQVEFDRIQAQRNRIPGGESAILDEQEARLQARIDAAFETYQNVVDLADDFSTLNPDGSNINSMQSPQQRIIESEFARRDQAELAASLNNDPAQIRHQEAEASRAKLIIAIDRNTESTANGIDGLNTETRLGNKILEDMGENT